MRCDHLCDAFADNLHILVIRIGIVLLAETVVELVVENFVADNFHTAVIRIVLLADTVVYLVVENLGGFGGQKLRAFRM